MIRPVRPPSSILSAGGGRKLYQQAAAAIAASIQRGDYRPGQRIPSERELAEEHDVSRPTIREALIALEVMGLVRSRHGSGIFVADNPPAETGLAGLDIGAFELTEARRLFEGETAALAALKAQGAKRRDEQRRQAGAALRAMRDRGEQVRDIAALAKIGEKQVRELIRLAEALPAAEGEAQDAAASQDAGADGAASPEAHRGHAGAHGVAADPTMAPAEGLAPVGQ